MARLSDAFIDDLLARTDIVEVINARVPLKRQGKEYSSRCPFHDERSASFTVSPTKQFYHCFGCQAHGTAISFLMNYDRLEFLDAVDELAKRAGIEVPRETQQRNENSDVKELFNAMEATSRFFQKQLAGNAGARAYLDGRAVDEATRATFAIGYAPDGYSALKDALGTDQRRMKLLERGGLMSKNDKGHVYDKFRDRVMFPIHDRRGRVIGFGGRVMRSEDSPKYLNSPETELFHKGRELYGLWQVRQANQQIARLIVVEGYMDVVALFQHGVTQAVATLGTATTPDHAELLFRNAPDVYFCFDGDNAGRKAAVKAMESVLPRMKDGRQAFFLFLPDGEDPDTIVRSEGAAGFDVRLGSAAPLSKFFFDHLSFEVDVSTPDGKSRLADRSKKLIATIPDGSFKDSMLELHAKHTTSVANVSSTALEWARTLADQLNRDAVSVARGEIPDGYLQKISTSNVVRGRAAAPGAVPTPRRSMVRSAIALLLQRPALALDLPPPYRFVALRQPGIELLTELVALVSARPEITTGALLENFEGRDEAAALQKLASQPMPGDEAKWQQEFLDAMAQLDQQVVQQRIDELQARVAEVGFGGMSAAEKAELRDLQMPRGR